MKNVDGQIESLAVDTLVVGAGVSGILESLRLKTEQATENLLLVDADNRPVGRATSGLHLVSAEAIQSAQLASVVFSEQTFAPAKIRWEKNWVSFDQVDWSHKDWMASLPQWSVYLRGEKKVFRGLKDELIAELPKSPEKPSRAAMKSKKSKKNDPEETPLPWLLFSEPVSRLEVLSESSHYAWKATTPGREIICRKVVWAAGIAAFQNAFGKAEAQEYLTGNSYYQKDAADFVGGIALDMELDFAPEFEAGFDINAVFALPIRHNSQLSLMVGVVDEPLPGQFHIRTLTHVHHELLSEPKELLSYQKSLRRAIKHILAADSAAKFDSVHEKWVVSPRVGAHMLGNPWCFRNGSDDTILFIGDQSINAVAEGHTDLLGALQPSKLSQGKVVSSEPPL